MDYDYLMRCVACRLCKMADFSKYTLSMREVTNGNKYLRVELIRLGKRAVVDCSEQLIRSVEPLHLAEQTYEQLVNELTTKLRLGE